MSTDTTQAAGTVTLPSCHGGNSDRFSLLHCFVTYFSPQDGEESGERGMCVACTAGCGESLVDAHADECGDVVVGEVGCDDPVTGLGVVAAFGCTIIGDGSS